MKSIHKWEPNKHVKLQPNVMELRNLVSNRNKKKHAKSSNLEMDGLNLVEIPNKVKSMHEWKPNKHVKLQPNLTELLNLPNLVSNGYKKDMLNHQNWKWTDLMW